MKNETPKGPIIILYRSKIEEESLDLYIQNFTPHIFVDVSLSEEGKCIYLYIESSIDYNDNNRYKRTSIYSFYLTIENSIFIDQLTDIMITELDHILFHIKMKYDLKNNTLTCFRDNEMFIETNKKSNTEYISNIRPIGVKSSLIDKIKKLNNKYHFL